MGDFNDKKALGSTGLLAGRLGVSSSFGAPAAAYEEAFERGCNYFTWGTFIKGRSREMRRAIRNIHKQGRRDELILSLLTYAHNISITERFLRRGLRSLGVSHADVLLLGYYSRPPSRRTIDGALRMKDKGLIRRIGITGHNRKLFPELLREGHYDLFHIRYNAAHRGAEKEVFPCIRGEQRPGVVTFTATRWRRLLQKKRMPEGEEPPSAADCYRFVLSHPAVDVCMMGARNRAEMTQNLAVLEMDAMHGDELERMRRIGDYVHPGRQ